MADDAQALRAEIAATREQLGATAAAIAYRANVPARAKRSVSSKVKDVRTSLGTGISQASSARTRSAVELRDGAGRSAGRAVSVARESPLVLALGSIAAGLLGGLLLPRARRADRVRQRSRRD